MDNRKQIIHKYLYYVLNILYNNYKLCKIVYQ